MKEINRNENSIFRGKQFFPIWCYQNKSAYIEREGAVAHDLEHEFLEIKYILEGSITYKIDKALFEIKKGDIVFINPYENHKMIKVDEGGCRYHLILISLDFFKKTGTDLFDLRRIFIDDGIKIFNSIKATQRLIDIFNDIIYEYFECKQGFQTGVIALVAELFVILLRGYTKIERNEDSNPRYNKMVQNAIVEISNHFAEKYTLDDLAKLCNMSKFHFSRIFKNETGMTAMQYLMHHRIKNAEMMLIHTDYKVSEIASKCGFTDVAHFSKVFKNHSKMSPQKFRDLHFERIDNSKPIK